MILRMATMIFEQSKMPITNLTLKKKYIILDSVYRKYMEVR